VNASKTAGLHYKKESRSFFLTIARPAEEPAFNPQPKYQAIPRTVRYSMLCCLLSFEVWIHSTEFTLSVVEWAQDKLVESFGFSAYLLSALRTSSFNIPCSIFDIPSLIALRTPPDPLLS